MGNSFSIIVGVKSLIVVGFRMNEMLNSFILMPKCRQLIFPLKEEGRDGVKGTGEGLGMGGGTLYSLKVETMRSG